MNAIMTNRTLWALGCGVALCLTACSGADPGADAPSASAATESDPPAETAAPPADETAPPADETVPPADGSTVSAVALCEYLTGELPDLRAIGSEVGAMANLTVNLFSWYDGQGAVPDGTEIDTLTQEQCPEVGAEALALAGLESFTRL